MHFIFWQWNIFWRFAHWTRPLCTSPIWSFWKSAWKNEEVFSLQSVLRSQILFITFSAFISKGAGLRLRAKSTWRWHIHDKNTMAYNTIVHCIEFPFAWKKTEVILESDYWKVTTTFIALYENSYFSSIASSCYKCLRWIVLEGKGEEQGRNQGRKNYNGSQYFFGTFFGD